MRRSSTAFPKLILRFAGSRDAAVAIISALVLIPLVAMIGVAADASRGFYVKSRLGQATDSAALAASRLVGTGQERAEALKYLNANFDGESMDARVRTMKLSFDEETDSVTVVAEAEVDTSFMQILDFDSINVNARSVVKRDTQKLELALVLDVTGSMNGSRLRSLKQSATDLIDIIYKDANQDNRIHVSLVPFSARVNVGTRYRSWLARQPGSKWRGCMETRSGQAGLDDRPPSAAKFIGSESVTKKRSVWQGGRRVRQSYQKTIPCPVEMSPLTDNARETKRAINDLRAWGTTRADIGLAWGWRSISKRWHGKWHGLPDAPSTDDNILKAIVLMTDGKNVPAYSHLKTPDIDRRLAKLCENIKDDDIMLFTITFSAPPSIDHLYRDCATAETNFFRSPDRRSLQRAFATIGNRLSRLRIAE